MVGTIFNRAMVSIVPCIFTALSLSRTVSRKLNSLKYLESITDALHRVKSWANDIELTEINKWC